MNITIRPDTTPHSSEAEQALLGALLINSAATGDVARRGGAALFFDPLHAHIFGLMAAKEKRGDLVSAVTISDALRNHPGIEDVGGVGYVMRLTTASPASAAVPGHIAHLSDLAAKRNLVAAISGAAAAIAKGEDAAAVIASRLEASLIASEVHGGANGPVSILKAVTLAMDQVNAAYQGEDDGSVRTGIASLDALLAGLYPGELILLGGRPSMGKTAVALSIALNAARAGHGVCIASLEMNPEAMAIRALSEATAQSGQGISYSNMRRGKMDESEVRRVIGVSQSVGNLPIIFLPRNYSDIGALFAGAKQAQRAMSGKMRLLVVDYLQLLRSPAKTRYEQITEISIALKALAGQLNVPILALSQLSREVEKRDDKRPIMSDLRESGQLEQDADAILFCYRDEYYLERERPDRANVEAYAAWQAAFDVSKNRLEIAVAKQRQGEVGTAHMRFVPATNLIWDFEKSGGSK